MQGVAVKGKRNLIRPNPHGQPQSALANHASSPRPLRCAVFDARAAALNRLILKGPKVAVDGRLRHESWQASDGTHRSRLRVVADDVELMSPRGAAGSSGGGARATDPAHGPVRNSGHETRLLDLLVQY